MGSSGWERSSAWTWVFASAHNTGARSGGFRYSPTTSRTFSTNCGSAESLKVSCLCGLRPNARQIRETAVCDMPVAAAIDRVDQCVASTGLVSSVLTTTASTASSVIFLGAPGRDSSASPSSPDSMNRTRHLPTICRVTWRFSATAVFVAPPAHAKTILARNASACADLRRRVHRSSVTRSSTDQGQRQLRATRLTTHEPTVTIVSELTTHNTRACLTNPCPTARRPDDASPRCRQSPANTRLTPSSASRRAPRTPLATNAICQTRPSAARRRRPPRGGGRRARRCAAATRRRRGSPP